MYGGHRCFAGAGLFFVSLLNTAQSAVSTICISHELSAPNVRRVRCVVCGVWCVPCMYSNTSEHTHPYRSQYTQLYILCNQHSYVYKFVSSLMYRLITCIMFCHRQMLFLYKQKCLSKKIVDDDDESPRLYPIPYCIQTYLHCFILLFSLASFPFIWMGFLYQIRIQSNLLTCLNYHMSAYMKLLL